MASVNRRIRGVVFDMDGTLTVPVIDFAEMRRRVGVTEGMDILDYIQMQSPEEQRRALAAIEDIEEQALLDMQPMPGAHQLCEWLDRAGVPRGLITRNVRRGVSHFHTHHFNALAPFEPAISRECAFPYKPSPAALQHICATWGLPAAEVVMVGDSAKDDVVCGNRAGCVTVLLDTHARYGSSSGPDRLGGGGVDADGGGAGGGGVSELRGETLPHWRVTSLGQLLELLQREFEVVGSSGSEG